MIYDKADEVIEEIFGSSSNKFQIGFEILMRVRDSVFDYVNLLHCKCYKINFEDGGSYIDSLDWIKSKKQQQILSMMMTNGFNTLQQSH